MEDLRPALVEVIAAWRRVRHSRLADLADFLEARVVAAHPRPPLPLAKGRAVWATRCDARDPLDFNVLLVGARGGRQADVIRQIEALAAWDDPRLATGLLALLADPPLTGGKLRGIAKAVVTALAKTRDRRLVARARELGARYLGIVNASSGGYTAEQLERLAKQMEAIVEPALPPELEARCAALEAQLGDVVQAARRAAAAQQKAQRSLDDLYAAVYAAPDEDAPRLVLADALTERGDEHGELIALQILRARGQATPDQQRREAVLMRDAARLAMWKQPLSNAGACLLERGFPVAVSLFGKSMKEHIGRPEWATVTRLEGVERLSMAQAVALLTQPELARVTLPGKIGFGVLPRLKQHRATWPWLEVGLAGRGALDADALTIMPAVRTLLVETDAGEVLPRGLFRPLTALRQLAIKAWPLTLGDEALAEAPAVTSLELEAYLPFERAFKLPPTLETLKLTQPTLPPGMLQDLPRLRTLELTLTWSREVGKRQDQFAGAFAALSSLTSLVLHWRNRELSPGTLAGLGRVERLELEASNMDPDDLRALTSLREADIVLNYQDSDEESLLRALAATPVQTGTLHVCRPSHGSGHRLVLTRDRDGNLRGERS